MENESGLSSKFRKVDVPGADAEVISPSSSGGFSRQGSMSKHACLCSPTKHAGSFRCRLHRNLSRTKSNNSSEDAKSEAST